MDQKSTYAVRYKSINKKPLKIESKTYKERKKDVIYCSLQFIIILIIVLLFSSLTIIIFK